MPLAYTQDTHDYVTFYKDAAKSVWLGPREKYCGSSFPMEPIVIPQDSVYVWFHR
jgi:hypothetical protein